MLLSYCTSWAIKTFHFIFHYNSCISWWIFTLETGINTVGNRCKIYNFSLTVCSVVIMLSAVRDHCGRRLPAVPLIARMVVATFAESRPMFVFFPVFVRVCLVESSGRKYFRFPHVLIKILSSELNAMKWNMGI